MAIILIGGIIRHCDQEVLNAVDQLHARVAELERVKDAMDESLVSVLDKRDRYREALEKIASMDCCRPGTVDSEPGEVAREALKD